MVGFSCVLYSRNLIQVFQFCKFGVSNMLAKIKASSHLKLVILLLDIAIVFRNYIQIFLLKGNLPDSKILLPAIDSHRS